MNSDAAAPMGGRPLPRSANWAVQAGVLFLGMAVVNAGNYGLNLVMGRLLPPADFAEATVLNTIVLLVACVAVAAQVTLAQVLAEASASSSAPGRTTPNVHAIRAAGRRFAAIAGVLLGLTLAAITPILEKKLHLRSPASIYLLAASIPGYLFLCVGRGRLQAEGATQRLAGTFQLEMAVRFAATVVLLRSGFGLFGTAIALSLSIFVPLLLLPRDGEPGVIDGATTTKLRKIFVTAGASQLAVVLFNQSDIFVAKWKFSSEESGQFSAVLILARIVFFATFALVTALVPTVAAKARRGEPHGRVAVTALLAVTGIGAPIVLVAYAAPALVMHALLGGNYGALAGSLGTYALGTLLFSLANILVDYHLALGVRAPAFLAVAAGLGTALVGARFATSPGALAATHLHGAAFAFALVAAFAGLRRLFSGAHP
jgi:O-antigen/teichoic acid export membrane protein